MKKWLKRILYIIQGITLGGLCILGVVGVFAEIIGNGRFDRLAAKIGISDGLSFCYTLWIPLVLIAVLGFFLEKKWK